MLSALCDSCPVIFFATKRQRLRHLKAKHASIKCNICDKSFITENSLLQHKHFVHIVFTLSSCKECEKSFTSEESLKQHMRGNSTHTSEQSMPNNKVYKRDDHNVLDIKTEVKQDKEYFDFEGDIKPNHWQLQLGEDLCIKHEMKIKREKEEYFEEDTKPYMKKLKLDNNIALKEELKTNTVIKHELEEKGHKNTVVHNIRKENQLNHETIDQKRALFVNCYNNFIQMALLREVFQTN